MTLVQLHLLAVGFWLGLVAAEVVLERRATGSQSRRTAAVVHRWIDVYFEIPILIIVVVTGSMLLARVWPGTPLLWIKVVAAAVAIAANVVCMPLVHARWKTTDDERARTLSRWIGHTGWGIPFMLVALLIGLRLTEQ